jgi:hypothetical protein
MLFNRGARERRDSRLRAGLPGKFTPPAFLAAMEPEVDGKIRSTFVRAVKPATA